MPRWSERTVSLADHHSAGCSSTVDSRLAREKWCRCPGVISRGRRAHQTSTPSACARADAFRAAFLNIRATTAIMRRASPLSIASKMFSVIGIAGAFSHGQRLQEARSRRERSVRFRPKASTRGGVAPLGSRLRGAFLVPLVCDVALAGLFSLDDVKQADRFKKLREVTSAVVARIDRRLAPGCTACPIERRPAVVTGRRLTAPRSTATSLASWLSGDLEFLTSGVGFAFGAALDGAVSPTAPTAAFALGVAAAPPSSPSRSR